MNQIGRKAFIVILDEGSRGILKVRENYRNEILAFQVSSRLGFDLVPETVPFSFKGEIGSLQRFVEGLNEQAEPSELDAAKLACFDFLINSNDRTNAHNCGVNADGRLVAFDNERSFGSSVSSQCPACVRSSVLTLERIPWHLYTTPIGYAGCTRSTCGLKPITYQAELFDSVFRRCSSGIQKFVRTPEACEVLEGVRRLIAGRETFDLAPDQNTALIQRANVILKLA